jgi:hypothetical protein
MNQYDKLAAKICRAHFEEIKSNILRMEGDSQIFFNKFVDFTKNDKTLGMICFVIYRDPDEINDFHLGGGFRKQDENGDSMIYVIIRFNGQPFKFSDLHLAISASIRHELEHFRQHHMGQLSEVPSMMGELKDPHKARKYFFHQDELGAYTREVLFCMRKKGGTYMANLKLMLTRAFNGDLHKAQTGKITDKGKQWLQLFEDVQEVYYKKARETFSHLSSSQLGELQIDHLID